MDAELARGQLRQAPALAQILNVRGVDWPIIVALGERGIRHVLEAQGRASQHERRADPIKAQSPENEELKRERAGE